MRKHLYPAIFAIVTTIVQMKAADLSVTGNLQVTGEADIEGNTLTVGSWEGSPGNAGLSLQYFDHNGESTITFDASRSLNAWYWRHDSINGIVHAMILDASHRLSLKSADGASVGITLDPLGISSYTGSVLLNGTDNTMPNQQLTGASSVMTKGLADSRYLKIEQSTLAAGSVVSAVGGGSIAFGTNVTAGNEYDGAYPSFALGVAGTATSSSMAIGKNLVSEFNSVTVGFQGYGYGGGVGLGNSVTSLYNSFAGGSYVQADMNCVVVGYHSKAWDYSIAIGNFSISRGDSSISVGNNCEAGRDAVAIGQFTKALKNGQIALGLFNDYEEVGEVLPTDNIFMLGNGSGDSQRSNAFVVNRNGDGQFTGSVKANEASFTGSAAAGSLSVSGNATISGHLQVQHLQPAGGLSMGEFTHDPEAQP